MSEPTPLTSEELEAIRENIRLYELDDGGATPAQGEYTDSDLAVRDIRRLLADHAMADAAIDRMNARATSDLAEFDRLARERYVFKLTAEALADQCRENRSEVGRLRELKCAVCGKRVAHLNHAGHVIGWGCADGENCKEDRLVQARAAGWDEGYALGVEDERISVVDPTSSPARVNPYRPPASGMPRPPAEAAADGSAADSGSTGVPEPQNSIQAGEWTFHADEDLILRAEPAPFPPATIPHAAMPHLAAFINALKPHHYHEAADSLRAIAEHRLEHSTDALTHARAEGIAEAARLLERGLEDLDDDTDDELTVLRRSIETTDLFDPASLPLAFEDRKRLLAEVDRLRARNKDLFRRLGEHMDDLGDMTVARDALAAKLDAVREIEPTLRRIYATGIASEHEVIDVVDELIGQALRESAATPPEGDR